MKSHSVLIWPEAWKTHDVEFSTIPSIVLYLVFISCACCSHDFVFMWAETAPSLEFCPKPPRYIYIYMYCTSFEAPSGLWIVIAGIGQLRRSADVGMMHHAAALWGKRCPCPDFASLPFVVRSRGRAGQKFWDEHVLTVMTQMGFRKLDIFVEPKEVEEYKRLTHAKIEIRVHARPTDFALVENYISAHFVELAGAESYIVQANDDVSSFKHLGKVADPTFVKETMQEVLEKMIDHQSGLGGFYQSAAYNRNGWSTGNVFVIEHLCIRLAHTRCRFSAYTSKIDLERSAASFEHVGNNVRYNGMHAITSKNKVGGFGSFADRPEESDAKGLQEKYPHLLENAHELKTGQWTLNFVPLFLQQRDAAHQRKNTKEGKSQREVALDDIDIVKICEAEEFAGGSATEVLEVLRGYCKKHGQILVESRSNEVGRKLNSVAGFRQRKSNGAKIWEIDNAGTASGSSNSRNMGAPLKNRKKD